MARALVLTATILLLIYMAANQPPPVKSVQVDYCVNTYRVARKHPITGEWEFGWGQGYGPCSQNDSYRNS